MPFARGASGDRMADPISPMKTASILLCAAAILCVSTSCDQHSWKETQVLHEGMHKAHGEGHGDAHAKEAPHGDKKEAAKH